MQNIDYEEVQKFSVSVDEWWDKKGRFRPLHAINQERCRFIRQKLSLDGHNVLDVGCGGGILSESLAKEGARVTAIDASTEAISAARRHLSLAGGEVHVDYMNIDAESLLSSGKENAFDVIVCMEVLEHVPSFADLVGTCSKLVKRGGDIFFSTIHRNVVSFLLAVLAAEYVFGILPKGTHDYRSLIRPAELAKAARHHGLDVLDIKGLRYIPWLDLTDLTEDPAVNYIVHCKRSTGSLFSV